MDAFGRLDFSAAPSRAFLLGNQGPDPLFYAVMRPRTCVHAGLGQQIHRLDPARIIREFICESGDAPLAYREVIRGFAAGFTCHFLLDSYVHPLIIGQQRAYCAAGVPGLTEADETDVHMFIERDIDEVALYATRGVTVADFDPSVEILDVDDWTLGIVSRAMAAAVRRSMGVKISDGHFARCVRLFRFSEHALHSPTGEWREHLSSVESKFRHFPFCRNMMLRPVEAQTSPFLNLDHAPWTDPFSGKRRNESFQSLAEDALADAVAWIPRLFGDGVVSVDLVREKTKGYDFLGGQRC